MHSDLAPALKMGQKTLLGKASSLCPKKQSVLIAKEKTVAMCGSC